MYMKNQSEVKGFYRMFLRQNERFQEWMGIVKKLKITDRQKYILNNCIMNDTNK